MNSPGCIKDHHITIISREGVATFNFGTTDECSS